MNAWKTVIPWQVLKYKAVVSFIQAGGLLCWPNVDHSRTFEFFYKFTFSQPRGRELGDCGVVPLPGLEEGAISLERELARVSANEF